MKVFKLTTENVDWGQYRTIIVVAESEEEAIKMVSKNDEIKWSRDYFEKNQGEIIVEEIGAEKGIVIAEHLGD